MARREITVEDLQKDKIWTIKHLQVYLMVCEKTARSEVRQAIRQDKFIVRKVGEGRGQYRIPRDSVLDYYEGRC